MSFNRKFNTNVWESPRQVHPIQQFANNSQNFYQNPGNFQFQNNNLHVQQNQNQNIRPLLSLPLAGPAEQSPQQYRKFNNKNNHNPDYRRPGPACSRNNNFGNNSGRWNKNRGADRNEEFKNRNNQGNNRQHQGQNDSFDNRNNSTRIHARNGFDLSFDQPPPERNEAPQFKSLVEELKAVQNSKKIDHQPDTGIDEICAKNASEASKKLLTQLKTMDKDGVRDLINNPKQPYKKKIVNIQAREKLREQMRRKLKILGDDDNAEYQLEPDECIDYENVPETFLSQIGIKTFDTDYEHDEMDLNESINEENVEDRDIEVVTKNLGSDFLMGSEMLLMNGFSLLGDEGESEIKAFEANIPKVPPLPAASVMKPPSPPPEPVPAPPLEPMPVPAPDVALLCRTSSLHLLPPLINPPQERAAFSSVDKPWSPIVQTIRPNARPNGPKFVHDELDIGPRNPDPPSITPMPISTRNVVKKPELEKPAPVTQMSIPQTPEKPAPSEPAVVSTNVAKLAVAIPAVAIPVVTPPVVILPVVRPVTSSTTTKAVDDEWNTPEERSTSEQPAEEGKRANETYGEYRRRLTAEREEKVSDKAESVENRIEISNNNQKSQQNFSSGRGGSNGRSESWMSNNRRNNNNSNKAGSFNNNNFNELKDQSRRSRAEMDRERDRNSNSFQQRNNSRDTNSSHENGRQRSIEAKDGHNYRFQNDKNSQEPPIDQLNTLLNPKPLQFKGSFNKRSGYPSINSNQRSRSRNRTPVNASMERDFDINLLPPANDARPCYYTLKKVMDIDAEMSRVHEKVHGIDKVISNLQLERVSHQRTLTKLQHDRKILFDNLMKRAISQTEGDKDESEGQPKEKEPQPSTSKSIIEKKLQNIVDSKKRKHDEQPEEPRKKKQAIEEVVETTSAAEKAAKLKKDREEEERIQQLIERRRLKKLRRQRERNEKARLEEKVRLETAASTNMTIKQEPVEKHVEREKTRKNQSPQQSQKPDKVKQPKKIIFTQSEIIQVENFTTKNLSVNLKKNQLSQSQLDLFKASGFIVIDSSEWKDLLIPVIETETNASAVQVETEVNAGTEVKVTDEVDKPVEVNAPEDLPEPVQDHCDVDPLAFDENLMNPPTPGSNMTNEESLLVEVHNDSDFSEWSGSFFSHDAPIVHLQNVNGKFIVCASESGKVYKYHLKNGKLAAVFSKHTEICNSLLYDTQGSIYTVSTDGFLYKIRLKTFSLVGSENFNEPLQAIEKSKDGIYVGTKSGSIFRLKKDLTEREAEPICNLGALILCMRATKEGSRNILLVSSRTNGIQVRDASDGLLLRSLSNDLVGISIYDMLIEGSTIYCGSNRHEIFSVDFTTGALKKSRSCGAGAICVKLYRNYLIAACYDGNIYIFDINKDDDAVNICGPSNMLLAMDLWGDKIIASTKDKTLKVMTIPT